MHVDAATAVMLLLMMLLFMHILPSNLLHQVS